MMIINMLLHYIGDIMKVAILEEEGQEKLITLIAL